MPNCLYCQETVVGRSDKKFCTPYCKSAYHYQQNKLNDASLFHSIDRQLKDNRRILKSYNKAGKSFVRKEKLIEEGFNPKYFTHYWKAQNGNVYLFCYEYGFMLTKEVSGEKYVLVEWQDYMKRK
jgi:hypothetical protein